MNDLKTAIKTQLLRQVAHWTIATEHLQDLDDLASSTSWRTLERYLGLSIRIHLTKVVEQLKREALAMQAMLDAALTMDDLSAVRRLMLNFRQRYVRIETTLDFFGDAINTRTSPTVGGYLRACDFLVHRSMTLLLDPLGKPTPVALTYIDKGLGASILKAGLRLWDGISVNPVAAIKISRHNLYRPTSLIHESGHQIAHILSWNDELASLLGTQLKAAPSDVAELWASWASEIAADAFAFAHTGYANVAALHDVVNGGSGVVFRYILGDPHPIPYLRVLLGIEMCRQFYGQGHWDDLARSWTELYPLAMAPASLTPLLKASLPLLAKVVQLTLRSPMRSFDRRTLVSYINPESVKPQSLFALEKQLGSALYTSMQWVWAEALRILALNGLRATTMTHQKNDIIKQQKAWMLRLGGALQAA